eukprot:m.194894 g.194894  ORF g.194894 m.194894 type:complete len:50 (-) comp19317_c0_seq1:144-293(-)
MLDAAQVSPTVCVCVCQPSCRRVFMSRTCSTWCDDNCMECAQSTPLSYL